MEIALSGEMSNQRLTLLMFVPVAEALVAYSLSSVPATIESSMMEQLRTSIHYHSLQSYSTG